MRTFKTITKYFYDILHLGELEFLYTIISYFIIPLLHSLDCRIALSISTGTRILTEPSAVVNYTYLPFRITLPSCTCRFCWPLIKQTDVIYR